MTSPAPAAPARSFEVVVIGGGFYGCYVALQAARSGQRVLIVEAEEALLSRASYANQARVHGGYHYPRSYLTGSRSRANFQRFVSTFEDCIHRTFPKYYAIAEKFSQVTARQFAEFCERIEAPAKPAPERITKLFNPDLIEAVFEVEEFAFDSSRLQARMLRALRENDVEIWTGTKATRVEQGAERLVIQVSRGEEGLTVGAREVWLCTYSALNQVLSQSGLPVIPLRYEYTEMALVELPDELRDIGVTVMDGPFFSLMPFPPRGLHTLSHVRYTPHSTWDDEADDVKAWGASPRKRGSNFEKMRRDSARFLPLIEGCRYVDSLWETKALLPRSNANQSRPILFRPHHGLPNLHCVLGAKIDNVFEIDLELATQRAGEGSA